MTEEEEEWERFSISFLPNVAKGSERYRDLRRVFLAGLNVGMLNQRGMLNQLGMVGAKELGDLLQKFQELGFLDPLDPLNE